MIKITDSRIGVRDLSGRITQYPQAFVNKVAWSRQANPTPTMLVFHPSQRYFCYLPMGIVRISDDLKTELLAVVNAGLPAKIVDNPPIVQAIEDKPVNEKIVVTKSTLDLESTPSAEPEKAATSGIVIPKADTPTPAKTNMRKSLKVSTQGDD